MTQTQAQTLKRVVAGAKPFYGLDGNGNRKIYQPGDEVQVSARCAKAFGDRLIDPGVAKAQKAAKVAEQNAAEATKKASAESTRQGAPAATTTTDSRATASASAPASKA